MAEKWNDATAGTEGAVAMAAKPASLGLQVQAPGPGAVLNPGDALTVVGVATGIPGAEQVGIDAVTIALAGAPIEASVTQVPKQKVPTYRFEADLTVPAVGGSQQLGVVAAADNNVDQLEVDVPVVIQSPVTPPPPPPWQTSQLAAPGAVGAGARIAAIAKPLGCELWWLGADGAVNGVWSEPGSAWASYQLAAPGSAVPSGGVSAISKGADAMEVWWIAPDGSVQGAYHDGGWAPYALTGPGVASTSGGITSVFKGGDSMEVWWIAPDGSVQGAYHDGGWAPYALTGSGVASTSGGITSVFKGGDSMEVWWIAPDGSVQGAYHDGGWAPYALTGSGVASTSGGITSVFKGGDSMEVWWVTPDGSVTGAFHESDWQTYTLAGPGSASTDLQDHVDVRRGAGRQAHAGLVDRRGRHDISGLLRRRLGGGSDRDRRRPVRRHRRAAVQHRDRDRLLGPHRRLGGRCISARDHLVGARPRWPGTARKRLAHPARGRIESVAGRCDQ